MNNKKTQLSFNGRVAVITGAGGGLGREYALLFASRGASVVVNDLGSTRSGEGNSNKAADIVVKEIIAKGGKAVANYDSVEEGEKIIATAIKNFGRVDILVNNAGILRDKSFTKISEEDWDIVHRVHLKGSFSVTKAAWPYFRQQNYGRIVMTSSGAGLFGNFGQSNYSSAKLGLVGLSNTLAVEGSKYNIHCNSIVPVAASRLTEDILPSNLLDQLNPSYIAPVVVWLCHEDCKDTGGIFESAGGWAGKYRLERSRGKTFSIGEQLTPEAVKESWSEVVNMKHSTYPLSIHDQMNDLMNNLTNTETITVSEHKEISDEIGVYSYKENDAILYALGVGATTTQAGNMQFLYENDENFSVLPNLAVNPGLKAVFEYGILNEVADSMNLKYDLAKTLHGEHYLEIYKPLPNSGVLKSNKPVVIDVLDKGSGAVMVIGVDTFDQNGEKICYNQFQIFLVGAGNFGGKRASEKTEIVPISTGPKRNPDIVVSDKTSVDQAALFRLNGDKNPLHIDPMFATIGGFSKPILHGLCSLGYATRQVLREYANNDVRKFKSVKARFTGAIVPGETIQTSMWREGNRIHFESIAKESGKTIISGAYVDLHDGLSASKISVNGEDVNRVDATFNAMDDFDEGSFISDTIFEEIERRITMVPDIADKVNAIFQFNLFKDLSKSKTKVWTIDLKTPKGSLYPGVSKTDPPACIIEASDNDFTALAIGELDPIKGFMNGQIKVQGNPMLTDKLRILFEQDSSRMYDDSAKETFVAPLPSPPPPPPVSMPPPPPMEMSGSGGDGDSGGSYEKCEIDNVFDSWAVERLDDLKELIPSIKTIYQWNILKGGKIVSVWTCDFKNPGGAIHRGPPKTGKPDCTLNVEDEIIVKLFEGKEDPMKCFMSGKLKITGNILAAQKLQRLWNEEANSRPAANVKKPTKESASKPAELDEDIKAIPITGLKGDLLFSIFKSRLHEEPDFMRRLRVIFQFNILHNGKPACIWTVDNKSKPETQVYREPAAAGIKVDCLITIDDEDLIRIMMGKVNPQRYFMLGKVKVKGNVMLIQKLNTLWLEYQKLGKTPELPLVVDILLSDPLIPGLRSEAMIIDLTQRLPRLPSLRQEIPGSYQFDITKDGKVVSTWTLNIKQDISTFVRRAPKDKAKAKITIDDIEFTKLVQMKTKIADAIANKKAKVDGDTNAVLKLHQLFVTPTSLVPKL